MMLLEVFDPLGRGDEIQELDARVAELLELRDGVAGGAARGANSANSALTVGEGFDILSAHQAR